jgi:transcriptional regulator NrdR family protein
MICPKCNFDKSAVVESRPFNGQVYRRRTCNMCNHLFKTVESQYAGSIPRARELKKPKPLKVGEYDSKTLSNVWK